MGVIKPKSPQHLPFFSSLDTHYYRFKLTNKGRRVQQLFWMNDDFNPKEKQSKKGSTGSSRRQSKVSQESTDSGNPVFQLHPVRMELYPGQTIDVILEGYSATPKVRGECVQSWFSPTQIPAVPYLCLRNAPWQSKDDKGCGFSKTTHAALGYHGSTHCFQGSALLSFPFVSIATITPALKDHLKHVLITQSMLSSQLIPGQKTSSFHSKQIFLLTLSNLFFFPENRMLSQMFWAAHP